MKKTRNSSIELLKIIGMLFIAISHSIPVEENNLNININIVSNNPLMFFLVILRNLGHIGNLIFIISSAWFLIDSKSTKKDKVINLIIDTFSISITFLIVIGLLGVKLSLKDIIKQFIPVILGNNWFISCYILLYIIHPFLNIIIRNINQKTYLKFNLLLVLYLIIQFVFGYRLYCNDFISFIVIYFGVGYIKLYMKKFYTNKKINYIILISSSILYIIALALLNILGLHFNILSNRMLYWNKINNILFIAIGISLFNIVSAKQFSNKFVNYIASLSLYFYLIHENLLFRRYVRPLFYEKVFQYGHILLWITLEALTLFVGGIILATIYKETIHKLASKLSIKLCKIIDKTQKIIEICLNF